MQRNPILVLACLALGCPTNSSDDSTSTTGETSSGSGPITTAPTPGTAGPTTEDPTTSASASTSGSTPGSTDGSSGDEPETSTTGDPTTAGSTGGDAFDLDNCDVDPDIGTLCIQNAVATAGTSIAVELHGLLPDRCFALYGVEADITTDWDQFTFTDSTHTAECDDDQGFAFTTYQDHGPGAEDDSLRAFSESCFIFPPVGQPMFTINLDVAPGTPPGDYAVNLGPVAAVYAVREMGAPTIDDAPCTDSGTIAGTIRVE